MKERKEAGEGRVGLVSSVVVLCWAIWSSREVPTWSVAAELRGAPIDAAIDASSPREPAQAQDWAIPEPGERVEFERLAFDDYDPPELRGAGANPLAAGDFPAAAGQLDGRDLRLAGFPLVVEMEDSQASELLLTRFPPGCCFGSVPVLDEWVLVHLREAQDLAELPGEVVVRGRLEVGEVLDASGLVGSIYRLREAELETE